VAWVFLWNSISRHHSIHPVRKKITESASNSMPSAVVNVSFEKSYIIISNEMVYSRQMYMHPLDFCTTEHLYIKYYISLSLMISLHEPNQCIYPRSNNLSSIQEE
jgi:hypothetical protein